ncbi:MAG: hypothetical protein RLZZ05_314, partial [Bacteroidota bacterium]
MKVSPNYLKNAIIFCVFFLSLPFLSLSQTIRGVVTDSIGQPLVGATVNIKGTSILTLTDNAGNYNLSQTPAFTAKDVIIFSSVGYQTAEVKFNGNTNINVQLTAVQNLLNEVVVTALGITNKKRA